MRSAPTFRGSVTDGIELGRLERALELHAAPMERRRFEITGGAEPHYVDLDPDAGSPCDCADFAWRGGVPGLACKHLLRARLAEGDAEVIRATAVLLAATREYVRSLEQELHPTPIRLTADLKMRVALLVGHAVPALRFERERGGAEVRVLLKGSGAELGRLLRGAEGVEFRAPQRPGARAPGTTPLGRAARSEDATWGRARSNGSDAGAVWRAA